MPLDKNEIIPKILARFEAQGGLKAYDPVARRCRYRHGEYACAVGALIADEHYDAEFEGVTVGHSALLNTALRDSGVEVNPDTIDLLEALQREHDYIADRYRKSSASEQIALFREGAHKIAQDHGLDTSWYTK